MKKFVIVLLMLIGVLAMTALAGCGKDSDSNVKSYDQVDDLNEKADVELNIPEDAEKAQFQLLEGNIAQSDYYIGDIHYVVRVAKGQQENLSQLSADEQFTNDETTEISGLSTRLRYNVYEASTDMSTTYGIADAYDAETDISYCVFMVKDGNKELLTNAMQNLITGETEVTAE